MWMRLSRAKKEADFQSGTCSRIEKKWCRPSQAKFIADSLMSSMSDRYKVAQYGFESWTSTTSLHLHFSYYRSNLYQAMFYRSTILISLLGASAFASPLFPRQSDVSDNSTLGTFEKIPISKDLNYVPCFENFTCARLEVPLDYQDPEIGSTHVALMRWNTPKQPAKGDIIFNPGGPGISAIDSLMALSTTLIRILGDQYNIVALEPRFVKLRYQFYCLSANME